MSKKRICPEIEVKALIYIAQTIKEHEKDIFKDRKKKTLNYKALSVIITEEVAQISDTTIGRLFSYLKMPKFPISYNSMDIVVEWFTSFEISKEEKLYKGEICQTFEQFVADNTEMLEQNKSIKKKNMTQIMEKVREFCGENKALYTYEFGQYALSITALDEKTNILITKKINSDIETIKELHVKDRRIIDFQ